MATYSRRAVVASGAASLVAIALVAVGAGVAGAAAGTSPSTTDCAQMRATVNKHAATHDHLAAQRFALTKDDVTAHQAEAAQLDRSMRLERLMASAVVLAAPSCYSSEDLAMTRQDALHTVTLLEQD